jgi:hypothetical protein
MHRILLLTLMVAGAANSQESAKRIGIYLQFDSAPGPASIRTMEAKVEELLSPSGLALDWRMTDANKGTNPVSGLVVLTFKGACRIGIAVPPPRDFGTLGEDRPLATTKVVNGRVLPFGEVRCDEVRAALSYLPPGSSRAQRQTALGVALGRVVAHELYHVLAQTTRHTSKGLARAIHSLKDLISLREVGFSEDDWQAMRHAFELAQK